MMTIYERFALEVFHVIGVADAIVWAVDTVASTITWNLLLNDDGSGGDQVGQVSFAEVDAAAAIGPGRVADLRVANIDSVQTSIASAAGAS